MLDQTTRILKIVCLVLAVLVLYQLAQVVRRANPLAHVVIPVLPTLAVDKNVPPNAGATTNVSNPAGASTNKSSVKTNSLPLKSGNAAETNLMATAAASKAESNAAVEVAKATNSTNLMASSQAATANATGKTNVSTVAVESTTNAPGRANPAHAVEITATNLITGANVILPPALAGTNSSISNLNAGTNAGPLAKLKSKGTTPNGRPGMMMMGFNPRGPALPELPPEIKARIDRIFESEILAQAMRPLPMGLLGIAGDVAFLRTASGQTGLVKEGDSLGDLKLLRIGINRVLIEQGGQKKELMIFEGYGGKSLLPDKEKNPNEKTNN